MTYEDFGFECKRLDSIKIPRNDGELKERQALEQELWRKYSWMLPPQWQATMSWVVDKHKTKSLPTMPEFAAAVGMMREKGIIKTEACRSCGGTKMQYLKVRHINTGREFDACRPCSVCMIGSDWELKKELEIVSENAARTPLRMAHELTARGAYYALHRAESENIKFDEDVLMVIIQKAAEYEAYIEQKRSIQPPAPKNAAGLMTGILSGLEVEEDVVDWASEEKKVS